MKNLLAFILFWSITAHAAYQSLPTGGDEMIEIPGGVKNIDSSTNFITISMWNYLTSPPNNNVHDLICKGRSNDANKVLFHVRWRTNFYQFRYASPNGSFHEWKTDGTYSTNVLRHIAITFQYGTGSSIRFYSNGVSVSGSWVTGNGDSPGLTNDQSFCTGGVPISNSPFKGILNDVAVWYSILNLHQIQNLAWSNVKRMPLHFNPESIIVYYPLDDWARFGNKGEPANGEPFIDMGFQRYTPRMAHAATPDVIMKHEYFLSYPPNE